MSAPTPIPLTLAPREEQVFPKLTAEQIARVAAHGRRRRVQAGEVLIKAGQQHFPFFVVTEGQLEGVSSTGMTEELIRTLDVGQFTGELNLLTGRRGLATIRVTKPGEVIEVKRDDLLALIQTDAELSEIFMKAFILRRVELIDRGFGDVVLLGSSYSAETLRIQEFLSRNAHPYTYIDLDRDSAAQQFLDRFHVSAEDVPVVICRGQTTLRNPTNTEIADCVGFNQDIDATKMRDVVIIGAGPAGLGAAVYAASEGLDVLMIEANAPGGQAGSSMRIENYLGFPSGITGQELATRAFSQAEKFGAQMIIAKGATHLGCDRRPYAIEIDNGTRVVARTVILATGAEYRGLPIENIASFNGAGVYYYAPMSEAFSYRDGDIFIVGGANSAGQAAMYFSKFARQVTMLVRGNSLSDTMSQYLENQIAATKNIEVKLNSRVIAVEGADRCETLTIQNNKTVSTETVPASALLIYAGAVPRTEWLAGMVERDAQGYLISGQHLMLDGKRPTGWTVDRDPFYLETSVPGIFVAGDVRHRSAKGVTSGVGEGAMAVKLVHQYLGLS